MNKVEENRPIKLIEHDFVVRIKKLDDDLNTGKMWMNENCLTQKKSHTIIRWIKCILSTLLPIDLFSSIKASRVALSYFEFVKNHREYLNNPDTVKLSKRVLESLNEKTQEKFTKKIQAYLIALDALDSSEVDQKPLSDNLVSDYLKQMNLENRKALVEKIEKEVAAKQEPQAEKNPIISVENSFDNLIKESKVKETIDLLNKYKSSYNTSTLKDKLRMIENLAGLKEEFQDPKIYQSCVDAIKANIEKENVEIEPELVNKAFEEVLNACKSDKLKETIVSFKKQYGVATLDRKKEIYDAIIDLYKEIRLKVLAKDPLEKCINAIGKDLNL